jgi:predicted membrane-bound mannosyltransferase
MAMLMLAVSPLEVFFSRYFIMEVPFVLELALFMAACWRYAKSERVIWILLAGTTLGMLHATKETFVINLGAMFLGWLGAQFWSDGFTNRNRSLFLSLGRDRHFVRWPWLWVVLLGVTVSVMLFSGFFRHWDDVGESVTTYGNYLRRSGGAGHAKPWHYYLGVLLYTRDYYTWSEAMVVGLALVGVFYTFTGRFQRQEERKSFLVFLSIYAFSSLFVYSIIPYKTPWTLMSVEYALVLLAGVGVQHLFGLFKSPLWRMICIVGMVGGLYNLCAQSMFSIHDPHILPDGTSPPNLRGPYVYSHTTTAAMKLVQRLRDLSVFQGKDFNAQVINVDSGWPLPWYLRDMKNIGYQTHVPETLTASVVVVDADLAAQAMGRANGKSYVSDIYTLRPGLNVMLEVEKGLWDAFIKSRSTEGTKP